MLKQLIPQHKGTPKMRHSFQKRAQDVHTLPSHGERKALHAVTASHHPTARPMHSSHRIPLLCCTATLASSKSSASSGSNSEMTLHFTILEDRVSPADFTAAASAALMLWTKKPQLRRNSLRAQALSCDTKRPSVSSRLYGCCCSGTVHAICSGPKNGPASPEDTSVVVLCFAIPGEGRD